VEDLPAVTGVPLIGRVPAGAGALDRTVFTDLAQTWIHQDL
jgi:hypothetical protein